MLPVAEEENISRSSNSARLYLRGSHMDLKPCFGGFELFAALRDVAELSLSDATEKCAGNEGSVLGTSEPRTTRAVLEMEIDNPVLLEEGMHASSELIVSSAV